MTIQEKSKERNWVTLSKKINIKKNSIKGKLYKIKENNKTICIEINHIMMCSKLSKKEYGKCASKFALKDRDQWYLYKSKSVLENEKRQNLLWFSDSNGSTNSKKKK